MSEWVTIQSYLYPQEASIAQAKLESMGVETFLQDELTTQIISGYSNAIGGVRLQVQQNKYEEARNILIKGGFIKDETIYILKSKKYPDKTVCPFCQSENIDSMERPSVIGIFLFYLSRFVFMFKQTDHCYDCKKHWKYER